MNLLGCGLNALPCAYQPADGKSLNNNGKHDDHICNYQDNFPVFTRRQGQGKRHGNAAAQAAPGQNFDHVWAEATEPSQD